jgi:hypothetical protein
MVRSQVRDSTRGTNNIMHTNATKLRSRCFHRRYIGSFADLLVALFTALLAVLLKIILILLVNSVILSSSIAHTATH